MKFKTTAKQIKNSYGKCIALGYCSAQSLLAYQNPIAYTCGVYGWNFDLYEVNGVGITTGYRGMVGQSVDYDLTREYETKAQKIRYDNTLKYEQQREQVNQLLTEYINKVFEG